MGNWFDGQATAAFFKWLDGQATAAFKPVDNGYVIRARWPSRYYLVNDAEKAAILERVREVRRVTIPAGVITWCLQSGLVMVVFMALSLTQGGHLSVIWLLALLLAVMAPIIAIMNIYAMYKLRPLLAGLRPTTQEEICWSDSFEALAKRTPLSWLVGLGFGSVAMGLMQAFALAENIQQGGPLDLRILNAVSVTCFVFTAIYSFALAFYRVART